MTTASDSKGIFRFLTKKDGIIEAAKAVDEILEIISHDETIPEGITTDFSRPTRFKTSLTDKPAPSAAMLSYTQKMRAALMSHGGNSDTDSDESEDEETATSQGWMQVTRRTSKSTPGNSSSNSRSYASVVQTAGSTQHTVSPLSSMADKSNQSVIKQIRAEFKQQSEQSNNTMRLFREEMRRELAVATKDTNNSTVNQPPAPATNSPDIAAMLEKLTTVVLELKTDFKEQNEKVQKMWSTWEEDDDGSARSSKKQKSGSSPRRKIPAERDTTEPKQALEEEDDGNGDGENENTEMSVEAELESSGSALAGPGADRSGDQ